MNLLYLMTEPFGLGGVQSDILALTDYFVQRNNRVFIMTRPGVLLDELQARGGRFLDTDCHFRGPAGFWQAAMSIRRMVREHGIDLVAPQSVRTSLLCFFGLRIVPFFYRTPTTGAAPAIVTTIHNIHNPVYFRYAGHILERCSDYVIFESHYERNRLLASGLSPGKSRVVHSGIDTDRFQVRIPSVDLLKEFNLNRDEHPIFAVVARLSEEKGHRYLLPAFARVQAAVPLSRLLVVGDGPLLEEVRTQADALGLGERVIFTGARRDIPDILSLIDVFVLASDRESFPLAAREAMAAGKPVIAPRVGGCPEVVVEGETGLLFHAADIDGLAAAMLDILEDNKKDRFGRAARQRVERLFSSRQWFEGNAAVYAEFTKPRRQDGNGETNDNR